VKKKKKNKKKTIHAAVDLSEAADLPNEFKAVEVGPGDDDEEEVEAGGDGKALSHLLQVTCGKDVNYVLG
jgi:hypothetical protein